MYLWATRPRCNFHRYSTIGTARTSTIERKIERCSANHSIGPGRFPWLHGDCKSCIWNGKSILLIAELWASQSICKTLPLPVDTLCRRLTLIDTTSQSTTILPDSIDIRYGKSLGKVIPSQASKHAAWYTHHPFHPLLTPDFLTQKYIIDDSYCKLASK